MVDENSLDTQVNMRRESKKKSTLLQNSNAFKQLEQRFNQFLDRNRKLFLKQKISNFYSKNYPMQYSPQSKFTEQWQQNKLQEKQQFKNLLEDSGPVYFCFSFIFMAVMSLAIWMMSYIRFFQDWKFNQNIKIHLILVFFMTADVIIKNYLLSQQEDGGLQFRQIILGNFREIIILVYLIIMSIFNTTSFQFIFIEIIIWVLLYKKASAIYQYAKVMQFGIRYEYQVKVFDLMCNILIQAHIFAIILYSATKLSPQKNWIMRNELQFQSPFNKYIKSLYFASTTMLTVGYGDITPQSSAETLINICIQIVGVISFGYLLSQMGHTLSKMRQRKQELQRDLQTITKIAKYYDLQKKLQKKAKSFIFNNQVKNDQLTLQDEKRLMDKLDQGLRDEINNQNSLSIVKSSIFFLCHWSKQFQSKIAQLLQKKLFAPNQRLSASNSIDRVFIIKKGKVDLFITRFGNQERKKVIRTIVANDSAEVMDNCYGYSAIFSNRPVKIQAIAKQFTATYSLSKQDFVQCMKSNIFDIQYFHEIKIRIDQSNFCEQWQAPEIKNSHEHYCPTRYFVFKKNRKQMSRGRNKRKFYPRKTRANFKLIQNICNLAIHSQMNDEDNDSEAKTIVLGKMQDEEKDEKIQGDSDQLSSEKSIYTHSAYQIAKQAVRNRRFTIAYDETSTKKPIAHIFQSYKVYRNFFPKHNITKILINFQKENFNQNTVKSTNNQFIQSSNVNLEQLNLSRH